MVQYKPFKIIFKSLWIISFCSIFISHSFSQTWFSGNPKWIYGFEGSCFDITIGTETIEFEKDTSIYGTTMKRFNWSHSSNTYGNLTNWRKTLIMYEEDDVVYRFVRDSVIVLYDFNRFIGDSLIVQIHADTRYCDSTLLLVLDTVEQVKIDDQSLRLQRWRILTNKETYGEEITILEKIGALGNFFFDMSSNWGCGLDHCYPYTFQCYIEEMDMIRFPSNRNCLEMPVNADRNGLADDLVVLYPNPVSDTIHIQAQTIPDHVEILQLDKMVLSTVVSKFGSFDVSTLPPGFFFVRMYKENELLGIARFSKQ